MKGRLEVLAETAETLVLRVPGQREEADVRRTSCVVYVPAAATAATVAAQLRGVADRLDKT